MLAVGTDTQTLVQNAKNLENGNFVIVAGLVVLVYDWMTSFPSEYEHFWRARCNLGTILFFMNRIVPILTMIFHLQTSIVTFSDPVQMRVCAPLLRLVKCLNITCICIVELLLALRTYALYDCSLQVLCPLLILIAGGFVNQLVSTYYIHPHPVPNYLPAPYTGCLLVGLPSWSWECLLPILVFEFCALALTLWKFWIYIKSGTNSKVPKILYRDGFIGFLAIIFTTSFGILVQVFRPRNLLTVAHALTPVVPTLIATHMLLNIRDVMKITSSSNMIRANQSISLNVLTPIDDAARRASYPSRVRHTDFLDNASAANVEMQTVSSLPRRATYEFGSGHIMTLNSISPLPAFNIAPAAAGPGSSDPGEYRENDDDNDEDDADTGHSVFVIQ